MSDISINNNSVKIIPAVTDKTNVDKKTCPNDTGIVQKSLPFIEIEHSKEDTVAISFKDKQPKQNSIKSLSFIENKEKDKGIKSLINNITTFGPVKIDKVSVPISDIIPLELGEKTKPVPMPGTGIEQEKEKKVALQIRVEF